MAHIAKTGACDFETIQSSLAWGTVMASFTIGAFGLDGIRGADQDAIASRLNQFREYGRIG